MGSSNSKSNKNVYEQFERKEIDVLEQQQQPAEKTTTNQNDNLDCCICHPSSQTILNLDEQLLSLMKNTNNIRNIALISRCDFGKSTFISTLKDRFSIDSSNSNKNSNHDYLPIQLHDKEIHSTYLINLIDVPYTCRSHGFIPYFRLADSCIIVIDVVEGFSDIQSLIPLELMKQEYVEPSLFLNKLDRFLLELLLHPQDMHDSIRRLKEYVQIYDYKEQEYQELIKPEMIMFGSGLQGWAFTLKMFAAFYSAKFGVPTDKLVIRLWGDHFFDVEAKKWTKINVSMSGKPLVNGFTQFILQPLYQLAQAILNDRKEQISKMITSLKICLPEDCCKLKGKPLFIEIMQQFLPMDKALLDLIVNLPSPIQAQQQCASSIYTTNSDHDPCLKSMTECNPDGPIMMYISKMISLDPKSPKTYAYGRVFSGTLRKGISIRILDDTYSSETKNNKNNNKYKIKDIVFLKGSKAFKSIQECPSGNIIALEGMDQVLFKSGTITDNDTAHHISSMKMSITPVVKVSIDSVNPDCLHLLVNGLTSLCKSDPFVQFYKEEENGKLFLLATTEEHLEVSISDLIYSFNVPVKLSEPMVCFKESVYQESNSLSHSNISVKVQPLDPSLLNDDQNNNNNNNGNEKIHWNGSNIIENLTDIPSGPFLNSFIRAFNEICNQGVVTKEPLRNVHFTMYNSTPSTNEIKTSTKPKELLTACYLDAKPVLLEPIYLVEMKCEETMIQCITDIIIKRQGTIISTTPTPSLGNDNFLLQANIPVKNSLGLVCEIRCNSIGKVDPNMVFDRWEPIGMIGEQTTTNLAQEIRQRKGLSEKLPSLNEILNKT